MIMADDFDFDDDFLFDDSESDFSGRPDIQPGKVSKGKQTYKTAKSLLTSFGKGMMGGLKSGLSETFPNTTELVEQAVEIKDDITNLKEDLSREMGPTLQTMSTIGARVMPYADKFIPKKLYDKAYEFFSRHAVDEDAMSDERRRAQEQERTISESIAQAFGDKSEQDAAVSVEEAKERQVDRMVESERFGQLSSILGNIGSNTEQMATFTAGPMTNYFKLSLELKYKHMFIAKDLFDNTKATNTSMLARLEEIKHNTGLPETIKVESAKSSKLAKTRVYQNVSKRLSNLKSTFFKNVKDSIMDKWDAVTMAVPMLDMATSMMGMMGSDAKLTKTKVAGFLTSFLTNFYTREFVKGRFDKDEYKQFKNLTEHAMQDSVGQFSLDLLNKAKVWQSDGNFIQQMFGDILREGLTPSTSTRIDNTLFQEADNATEFDMLTKTAIIATIPRHLEHIGMHVERLSNELASEGALVERRYDPLTGTLKTSGEVLKGLMDTALTTSGFSKYTRTRSIEHFKTLLAHSKDVGLDDKAVNEMFEANKSDLNKFITNVAINLDSDWQPEELRKFLKTGKITPYIKKAMVGVDNPKGLARMLVNIVFEDGGEGKVNTIINREIKHILYNEIKNIDTKSITEFVDKHKFRDLAIKRGLYDEKAGRIQASALHQLYQPEDDKAISDLFTVDSKGERVKYTDTSGSGSWALTELKERQKDWDYIYEKYKELPNTIENMPKRVAYELALGLKTPADMLDERAMKVKGWWGDIKDRFKDAKEMTNEEFSALMEEDRLKTAEDIAEKHPDTFRGRMAARRAERIKERRKKMEERAAKKAEKKDTPGIFKRAVGKVKEKVSSIIPESVKEKMSSVIPESVKEKTSSTVSKAKKKITEAVKAPPPPPAKGTTDKFKDVTITSDKIWGALTGKGIKAKLDTLIRRSRGNTVFKISVPTDNSGNNWSMQSFYIEHDEMPMNTMLEDHVIRKYLTNKDESNPIYKRLWNKDPKKSRFPVTYEPGKVTFVFGVDRDEYVDRNYFSDDVPEEAPKKARKKPATSSPFRTGKPDHVADRGFSSSGTDRLLKGIKSSVSNIEANVSKIAAGSFTRLDVDLSDAYDPKEMWKRLGRKMKGEKDVDNARSKTDEDVVKALNKIAENASGSKNEGFKPGVRFEGGDDVLSELSGFHVDYMNMSTMQISLLKEILAQGSFMGPVKTVFRHLGTGMVKATKLAKRAFTGATSMGINLFGNIYRTGVSLIEPTVEALRPIGAAAVDGATYLAAKGIDTGRKFLGGAADLAGKGFDKLFGNKVVIDGKEVRQGGILPGIGRFLMDNPDVAIGALLGLPLGGIPGAAMGGLAGGLIGGGGRKIVGAAKSIGSAVKGLFGPRYVDVYLKNKIDPGNPLLSANKQKEGVYFADGRRLKRSSDLKEPVFGLDEEGNVNHEAALVTKEQIEEGLVDIMNKPIVRVKKGEKDGAESVSTSTGSVILDSIGHLYKGVVGLLFGTLGSATRATKTILGRLFGIEGAEVKEYHEKSLDVLERIYTILAESRVLAAKKIKGDRDFDGDRDASWEDQLEGLGELKIAGIVPGKKEKVKPKQGIIDKILNKGKPKGAGVDLDGDGKSKGGIIKRTKDFVVDHLDDIPGMMYIADKTGLLKHAKAAGGAIAAGAKAAGGAIATGAKVAGGALVKGGGALAKGIAGAAPVAGAATVAAGLIKGAEAAADVGDMSKEQLSSHLGVDFENHIVDKELKAGLEAERLAKNIVTFGYYDKLRQKPLKDKDVAAFRKRMEKYIELGNENAYNTLVKFNHAIAIGDYDAARSISNEFGGYISGMDTKRMDKYDVRYLKKDTSRLEMEHPLGDKLTFLLDEVEKAIRRSRNNKNRLMKLNTLKRSLTEVKYEDLTEEFLNKANATLKKIDKHAKEYDKKEMEWNKKLAKDKAALVNRRNMLLDMLHTEINKRDKNVHKFWKLVYRIEDIELEDLTDEKLDEIELEYRTIRPQAVGTNKIYEEHVDTYLRTEGLIALSKKITEKLNKLKTKYGRKELEKLNLKVKKAITTPLHIKVNSNALNDEFEALCLRIDMFERMDKDKQEEHLAEMEKSKDESSDHSIPDGKQVMEVIHSDEHPVRQEPQVEAPATYLPIKNPNYLPIVKGNYIDEPGADPRVRKDMMGMKKGRLSEEHVQEHDDISRKIDDITEEVGTIEKLDEIKHDAKLKDEHEAHVDSGLHDEEVPERKKEVPVTPETDIVKYGGNEQAEPGKYTTVYESKGNALDRFMDDDDYTVADYKKQKEDEAKKKEDPRVKQVIKQLKQAGEGGHIHDEPHPQAEAHPQEETHPQAEGHPSDHNENNDDSPQEQPVVRGSNSAFSDPNKKYVTVYESKGNALDRFMDDDDYTVKDYEREKAEEARKKEDPRVKQVIKQLVQVGEDNDKQAQKRLDNHQQPMVQVQELKSGNPFRRGETAFSFDRTGRLRLMSRGKRDMVKTQTYEGGSVLHTHPDNRGLSMDDIEAAINGKLKSIYAVTPDDMVHKYDTWLDQLSVRRKEEVKHVPEKEPDVVLNTDNIEAGLSDIHVAENMQVKQLEVIIHKLTELVNVISDAKSSMAKKINDTAMETLKTAVSISDAALVNKTTPKANPKRDVLTPSNVDLSKAV